VHTREVHSKLVEIMQDRLLLAARQLAAESRGWGAKQQSQQQQVCMYTYVCACVCVCVCVCEGEGSLCVCGGSSGRDHQHGGCRSSTPAAPFTENYARAHTHTLLHLHTSVH